MRILFFSSQRLLKLKRVETFFLVARRDISLTHLDESFLFLNRFIEH